MQKLYRTISFLLAFVILSNIFSSQHISASDLSQSEYDLSLGTSPENERGLIEETLYSDKLAVDAEAEPYIISEIKSKRTENTKYFKLSSGAYCAVQYDIPVHYRSADGTWSDYDNTLTASAKNDLLSADSLLRLQTKSSDKSISLAPYATGNGDISIEKDGYAVSWGYKKAVKPASGAAKAVSFVFASESENIKRVPAEITSLSKTRSAEAEGNDSFLVLRDLREEIYYRNVFEEADLQYIISPEGIKENIILKSGSAASEYR